MAFPSPILADDDPVLLNVLRLAGLGVSATDPTKLDCSEGLTLEDAKAACYAWREEYTDEDAMVDNFRVADDLDGWAQDTLVMWDMEGPDVPIDSAASQPVYGWWTIDEAQAEGRGQLTDFVYLRGFSYDMHGAAGALLDMLAARMKQQFDFNDGSGNYARSQKYAQTKQSALDEYRRARPKVVDMNRDDTTPGGTFWGEVWADFASQDVAP